MLAKINVLSKLKPYLSEKGIRTSLNSLNIRTSVPSNTHGGQVMVNKLDSSEGVFFDFGNYLAILCTWVTKSPGEPEFNNILVQIADINGEGRLGESDLNFVIASNDYEIGDPKDDKDLKRSISKALSALKRLSYKDFSNKSLSEAIIVIRNSIGRF
jgi:hypothetical protein